MTDAIWKSEITIQELSALRSGCMLEHLDIVVSSIGNDTLTATMPVDHRTTQPFGLLHGGAAATLAETLGSLASQLIVGFEQKVVGIELNITHLRQATSGRVEGTATPIKIGRRMHTWQIDIYNDLGKQVSRARLSVLVVGE